MVKRTLYILSLLTTISIIMFLNISPINSYNLDQTATISPTSTSVIQDGLGFEMVYVPEGSVEMGISIAQYKSFLEMLNLNPQDTLPVDAETGIFDTYQAHVDTFWIDKGSGKGQGYTK